MPTKELELRIKELTKDIKRVEKKGTPDELINLLHQRGQVLRKAEQFTSALEDHKKEIRISEKLGSSHDKKGMAIAYHQYIETCLDLRDGESAMLVFDKYYGAAKNCGVKLEKLRALLLIGRVYLESGEKIIDDAYFFIKFLQNKRLELYRKAHETFQKANDIMQMQNVTVREVRVSDKSDWVSISCGILLYNGILKYRQEKHDESLIWIQSAIREAQNSNFCGYLYRAHICLCDQYLIQKAYSKMLIEARNAVKFGKILQEPAKQIDSKMVEAKAQFLLNELKKGIKALRNAYKILMKAEKDEYFAGTMEEKVPEAMKADVQTKCKAALFIIENLASLADPDSDLKVGEKKDTCEKIADNYVTIENLDKAVEFYLAAIELAESMGTHCSRRNKAALYVSAAMTFQDKFEYDKAIEYYKKELTIHEGNETQLPNIKEAFRTRTLIAKCKFRAREVHHSTKYSVEEIIQEHALAVTKSEETNYHASKLDAINNYCHCLDFYEKKEDAAHHREQKRKWLDMINMTEEEVRAASMEAATPAPANHDVSEVFDLLADSNEISSSEEEDNVQEELSTSEVEFKVPEIPSPDPKRRRVEPQVDVSRPNFEPGENPTQNSNGLGNRLRETSPSCAQAEGDSPMEDEIEIEDFVDPRNLDLKIVRVSTGMTETEPTEASPQVPSNNSTPLRTTPAPARRTSRATSSTEGEVNNTTINSSSNEPSTSSIILNTSELSSPSASCVHIRVQLKSNNTISILVPLKAEDLHQNVQWLREQCSRRFSRVGLSQEPILFLSSIDNALLFDEDSLEDVTRGADMNVIAISHLEF